MLLASAAIACGCASGARTESRVRVTVEGAPPVDVLVSLSPERAAQQVRWTTAAESAVRQHLRMLGSTPATAVTIVDRSDREAGAAADGAIGVTAPLWSSSRGMAVERAVSSAVARAFWRREIPCGPASDWFVDGLARYEAVVSIASQYDGALEVPAIGAFEQRLAGGFVPWVVRTPVPAWSGSRSAYRARAGLDPAQPRSAADRQALEAKTALSAQTLAAWIGSPTWQAVLHDFVERSRGRCASWRDLQQSAADISGFDLSWFFDQAFASGRIFDYGVDRFASEPAAAAPGRYRTALVVRRFGDALFTGSAEPPVAPFESGRGVEIAVRFADGTERAEHWDGRAASRTFEYDGASPAVSATVDPRLVIQLDANRTNNSRTLAPRQRTAATRWAVLWTAWLQHLLLTYGSLV